MKLKKCFKCGEIKPLSEFYRHSQMKDGHLNKCSSCSKTDVKKNRSSKIEYYREYDRARGNRQGYEYTKVYRAENYKKHFCHASVRKAIRNGFLKKMPCEVCGSKNVVGHHDDYDKPLDVRWLCQEHHVKWHIENGSGKNG